MIQRERQLLLDPRWQQRPRKSLEEFRQQKWVIVVLTFKQTGSKISSAEGYDEAFGEKAAFRGTICEACLWRTTSSSSDLRLCGLKLRLHLLCFHLGRSCSRCSYWITLLPLLPMAIWGFVGGKCTTPAGEPLRTLNVQQVLRPRHSNIAFAIAIYL